MKRRKSLKIFLIFATVIDFLPLLAIGLVSATALADPSSPAPLTSSSRLGAQLEELQKAASDAAASLNTFAVEAARFAGRSESAGTSDRGLASVPPPTVSPPAAASPGGSPASAQTPAEPSTPPAQPSHLSSAPQGVTAAHSPTATPSAAPAAPRTSISRNLADDSKIAGYATPLSPAGAPASPAVQSKIPGTGTLDTPPPASAPRADSLSRRSINSSLDALTALPPPEADHSALASRHGPIRPDSILRADSDNGSTDPNELTLGEIKRSHLFSGFNAEIIGRDPDSTAVLRGTVFSNCAGYFQFDEGRTRSGDIGFIIRDPGGHGRACVKEGRDVLHMTCATTRCISLSHLDGTHIQLAREGDVRIGLLHTNPSLDDEDPNRIVFESLGLRPHVSARTLIARRREERRARKQAEITKLRWNIAHCRQNSDQILQDHSDLELLRDLTHMSEAQFNTLDKDLKIAEFNLLKKRANALGVTRLDRDKLDELLNDLDQFANDNEGFSDATAQIESNLAYRITQQGQTNPAAWQSAAEILGDASGLPNLSSTWTKNIQASQTEVAVGNVTAMAISPRRDNAVFVPAYESLMNSVMQNFNSNCSSPTLGAPQGGAQDQTRYCQLAQYSYASALRIPQEMQQAQLKNAQAQLQRQQALLQLQGQQNQFQGQQNLMFPMGSSAMANPLQPNLAGIGGGDPLFTMPGLNLAPAGGLTPL